MENPILIPAAVLLFLAGSVGCFALLRAGREYVAGRWDAARRRGRRGGLLLCAGDLGLAGIAATTTPLGAALAAAAALATAAALTGLLGGLAGKPRPSGELAALLHFAAGCLLVLAS